MFDILVDNSMAENQSHRSENVKGCLYIICMVEIFYSTQVLDVCMQHYFHDKLLFNF